MHRGVDNRIPYSQSYILPLYPSCNNYRRDERGETGQYREKRLFVYRIVLLSFPLLTPLNNFISVPSKHTHAYSYSAWTLLHYTVYYSDYHHYRQFIFLLILYKTLLDSVASIPKTVPLTRTFQNYFPASPTTRFSFQIKSSRFRYWPQYPYAILLHQLHSINAIPILKGVKEG
jgi:hypothetical protein